MSQQQQSKLITSALRRILFQPKYVPYADDDPRRHESERGGWQNGGEQDSGRKRGKFIIDED